MVILNGPSDGVADLYSRREPIADWRQVDRSLAILIAWLADTALLIAASYSATFLRFSNLTDGNTSSLLVALLPTFMLAAITLDCYDLQLFRRPLRSARKVVTAFLIAASFAFTAAFAFQVGAKFSRLETALMVVSAITYLALGRIALALALSRMTLAIDQTVVILGRLKDRSGIGNFDIVAPRAAPDPDNPIALEQTFFQVRHADRVLLAFDDAEERAKWISFMRLIGVDAEVIAPGLREVMPIGLGKWEDQVTLVVARGPMKLRERAAKRFTDVSLGIGFLILLAPLLVVVAILIKLDSPGPALFVQPRVGRNNRRYNCYKFRTMRYDSNDLAGGRSATRDDDRITRLGRFLRRTSVDELPQLLNVVTGEMSLVGPRPHALGSRAEGSLFWEAVSGYWMRHAMKPGITGLAQIRGLRGGNVSQGELHARLGADLEYINNWSIWLDLKVLFKTIAVLLHRNAY